MATFIVISSYFLLLVIFILPAHIQGQNECGAESLRPCKGQTNPCGESLRCGGHGPDIRFPFKLKDRHPDYCPSPHGFLLYCTDTNQTVLELPVSVKLFVQNIDYKSRRIQLNHPDRCFLRDIRHLNLSSSPFRHYLTPDDYPSVHYAFFSCSRKKTKEDEYSSTWISCLSGPTHQVHALDFNASITYFPLPPCKRIYNVRSIPGNLKFYRDDPSIYLKWSRQDQGTSPSIARLVTAVNVISGSFFVLSMVFALPSIYFYDMEKKEYQVKIEKFLEDYRNFKPTRYSYTDIKKITNQFAEKLGQGAYGTVFKGKLSDQIYVAVKILNNNSKENGEEFINEVGIMGRIHHVNVVRLVGFCADGFIRALVYEFLSNYSLEKFIFSDRFVGWKKLQDIAIGVAKGIEYLHQGCDHQILHFDIKPHNVLLDQNFNPKISDFGLAKLCSKDQSVVSMSTCRGTRGYIAPEVFSRNFGNVSYKADIYSFGMMLLDIVCGERNVNVKVENTSNVYYPEWIYNILDQKEELRLPIEDDGDTKIVEKLAIVGLWCIQWHPMDRPSMKLVVQMLEEEGDKLIMPPNPFASLSPKRIHAQKPTTRLGSQELEVIPELD